MSNLLQQLEVKVYALRLRVRRLAENNAEGVWRTVRGRRIFIREGEDLDTALKRSLDARKSLGEEDDEPLKELERDEVRRKALVSGTNPTGRTKEGAGFIYKNSSSASKARKTIGENLTKKGFVKSDTSDKGQDVYFHKGQDLRVTVSQSEARSGGLGETLDLKIN